jgi:hypothetical protein
MAELLTYGEQLLKVQEAINTVQTAGQRYELGGRTMWRADLPELHRREKDIQANLDRYGDVLPNRTARSGMAVGVSFG